MRNYLRCLIYYIKYIILDITYLIYYIRYFNKDIRYFIEDIRSYILIKISNILYKLSDTTYMIFILHNKKYNGLNEYMNEVYLILEEVVMSDTGHKKLINVAKWLSLAFIKLSPDLRSLS